MSLIKTILGVVDRENPIDLTNPTNYELTKILSFKPEIPEDTFSENPPSNTEINSNSELKIEEDEDPEMSWRVSTQAEKIKSFNKNNNINEVLNIHFGQGAPKSSEVKVRGKKNC